MLVLTRKATQQIQIGDNVVITILQVKGQSVRVGIEAPREVRVVRAELPRFEQPPVEPMTTPTRPGPAPMEPRTAGFQSPRVEQSNSQEGCCLERRRMPSALRVGASSIRPQRRVGPSSLKELVAARRARS